MDDGLSPLESRRRADIATAAAAVPLDAGFETPRPAATPGPVVFQYRVLKALVLREMSNRHGESRLGYLLGVILPLLAMGILFAAWQFRGRAFSTVLPLGTFVVTGYPLWLGFRGVYNRVTGAASRSDALLMFPQITQLDLIFAAMILEISTNTVVYVIMVAVVLVVFGEPPPADPFGVLMLYWACCWIGAALGLVLCGVFRLTPTIATIFNSFLRFGMWMSGVIFSVDKLPSWLWPYLKWNPILHCIEGARHVWLPSFNAPIFDPAYIIASGFVLTAVGFILERLTRRFVGP